MPSAPAVLSRRLLVGALVLPALLRPTARAGAKAADHVPDAPASGPRHLRMPVRQDLRSGLGFSHQIVATIPRGSVVSIRSRPRFVDGHTWYEVSAAAGRGWVAVDFAG